MSNLKLPPSQSINVPLSVFASIVTTPTILGNSDQCILSLAYTLDEAGKKVKGVCDTAGLKGYIYKTYAGTPLQWFLDRAELTPQEVSIPPSPQQPPHIETEAAAAIALELWLQSAKDVTEEERIALTAFIQRQKEKFQS